MHSLNFTTMAKKRVEIEENNDPVLKNNIFINRISKNSISISDYTEEIMIMKDLDFESLEFILNLDPTNSKVKISESFGYVSPERKDFLMNSFENLGILESGKKKKSKISKSDTVALIGDPQILMGLFDQLVNSYRKFKLELPSIITSKMYNKRIVEEDLGKLTAETILDRYEDKKLKITTSSATTELLIISNLFYDQDLNLTKVYKFTKNCLYILYTNYKTYIFPINSKKSNYCMNCLYNSIFKGDTKIDKKLILKKLQVQNFGIEEDIINLLSILVNSIIAKFKQGEHTDGFIIDNNNFSIEKFSKVVNITKCFKCKKR
jgi:hypothetical protein